MSRVSQSEISSPSVAVVIPTHNRWPMLVDAIDSVLNQSYKNVICVVVDDASTDNSVLELKRKYGDSIRLLVNRSNKEKSASRNRGVIEVEADLVCFLDSDDLLTKNSIESRVRVFQSDPQFKGVSFGDTCRGSTQENNDKTIDKLNIKLDLQSYINNKETVHTSGFLISRAALLAEGLFCESLTNREDIELLVRLFNKYEFRHCGELVSILRTHGDNRARSNWDKIIRQGNAMSHSLESALGDKLTESMKQILLGLKREEHEELLRALYRKKYYSEFIVLYKKAKKENLISENFQWLKRKCLAQLLAPFSSGSTGTH
ncbi:glycosyltransferase family A protein [Aurantivibrio infirmus]